MSKRVYYLSCMNCNCTFEHKYRNKKYCPKCEKKRENKTIAVAILKYKTIPEVVLELENYNKVHGTNLSYGEYVGKIKGA